MSLLDSEGQRFIIVGFMSEEGMVKSTAKVITKRCTESIFKNINGSSL